MTVQALVTALLRSRYLPRNHFPLETGTVYTAPWISAFVGGDITAGLLSCHLPSSGENALFLDLGTNGEMVLNHKGKLYTAATAAGPAFEGNGLSCGCPGISGAISHVVLRTLFPSLTTINNAHPIGICGSGAISLCAELLRKHYVTSDGVLTEKFKTDGIVLSKSPDGKSITFLPEDLRSIQLAIAAIAAGIDILLANPVYQKRNRSHYILAAVLDSICQLKTVSASACFRPLHF